MDQRLQERLNQIPEKIFSPEFLSNQGLGNEIGFWIFDYDAASELAVREYVEFLDNLAHKKHRQLKLVSINLLDSLMDYLKDRNFVDKAVQMQKTKGDEALMKALKGPLHVTKFAPYLVDKYRAYEADLVLMSGVGSVWPLIRSHDLLNSLHALMGDTPLVLFYPGDYTGQSMSLFGRIESNNYYRAFSLVPR